MRVFSNTILPWPTLLSTFQAARLYPGRWGNYYIYIIDGVEPVKIRTYSPLKLLQENRYYYCYDNFNRNKRLELFGTVSENICISDSDSGSNYNKIQIYYPKIAYTNDVIVINDNSVSGHPSISNSLNPDSILI